MHADEIQFNISYPRLSASIRVHLRLIWTIAFALCFELRAADWSFRNDVQPLLAKTGCSTGACHGAAAGKNGLKLSLRGYDDEGDYRAITRQSFGRRVDLFEPAESLILKKPTGAVPHKGGVRFATDSLEYKILSEWIAGGAPGPKESDPRIQRIEMEPPSVRVKVGDETQFVVWAYFSDGTKRDVTRFAKYTAANSATAVVDDFGKAKATGNGEGAITAWYLSRIAIATVSVPYAGTAGFHPAPGTAGFQPANFIDDLVLEKWKQLNLEPSARAGDSDFLRRAFLDTIGVLPSGDEARAFLADKSEDKRATLVEKLLARPEFVDYWTYKWCDMLLVSSEKLSTPGMWSYYNWIRGHVARNTPWDKFVRELVTAKGSSRENGAANFYVLHEEATDAAETTAQAFLGLSITCAKCHNHPLEKWTNDQYFAMANLFGRVRTKNDALEGGRVVFCATEGDVIQPLTGKPRTPQPLDGTALKIDDPSDRREAMADWLVSKENTYFARAIANRIWANFFNIGLVMNVDDLRVTNPASNEKLLSALADHLKKNNFDLKALMRAILNSETYQRSSEPTPENAGDTRYYARYFPRRIMAEVLLDALSQVTQAPTKFSGYPDGWRALQLPDSNVASYFLKSFGRPNRQITCECERTGEPSMAQVLHIANGDTLNQKLEAKGSAIEKAIAAKLSKEKIIEDLYLGALSRFPTETEKSRIEKLLATLDEKDLRAGLEDLYWGVLSSKEFLFNH